MLVWESSTPILKELSLKCKKQEQSEEQIVVCLKGADLVWPALAEAPVLGAGHSRKEQSLGKAKVREAL